MTGCRTLLVDDEPDILALVALQLALADDGLTVAGTAACGEDAVRVAAELRPDAVVLDYLLPDANGLEVAARLLDDDPERTVILFSAFLTEETLAEAGRLGVRECVLKDRARDLPKILRRHVAASSASSAPG